MGGIEFTVVGVVPEGFDGIEPRLTPDAAYVPLAMWPRLLNGPAVDPLAARDFRYLMVKGRLKPAATLAGARAELTAVAKDLDRAHPGTNASFVLTAQTELEPRFERSPLDSRLLVLLTALAVA